MPGLIRYESMEYCSVIILLLTYPSSQSTLQRERRCAGAVFLVVLAAVDAAFSGDWSRVGVIPKRPKAV